jgi:hypothetical protein
MRVLSLDIHQLIKIATSLMLQRKELPGEKLCQMLMQGEGPKREKAIQPSVRFLSAYLLCSINE